MSINVITMSNQSDLIYAQAITHGGVFHADDVFATVILEKVFKDITISRVFKVPENCTLTHVYDIGNGRFDHHQKDKRIRPNGIPYAACGLLWEEYGDLITRNPEVTEIIERDIIMGIDTLDNGVQVLPSDMLCQIQSVSSLISAFNPTWDSAETSDEAFVRACDFARVIFDNALKNAQSKILAKDEVEMSIDSCTKGVMILERFLPWQEHLFNSQNPKAQDILFVVYPSNRGGYNWQCVPDAPNSFGQRKPVPEGWRGANAETLRELTGVKTATFCHPSGFLGSCETLHDAYKMARLAMKA